MTDSGQMFRWIIFMSACKNCSPSIIWISPYLISISCNCGNWFDSFNCGIFVWFPSTFDRLAKIGSVTNAMLSRLSSNGCCTVKMRGCRIFVSCVTPRLSISRIVSRSSFVYFNWFLSNTKTETFCFVVRFVPLYTFQHKPGQIDRMREFLAHSLFVRAYTWLTWSSTANMFANFVLFCDGIAQQSGQLWHGVRDSARHRRIQFIYHLHFAL